MTTDQIIKQIRSGMRLISDAFNDTQMTFNQGFSTGSVSLAFSQGVIGQEDWVQLNKEILEAVKSYQEKNK